MLVTDSGMTLQPTSVPRLPWHAERIAERYIDRYENAASIGQDYGISLEEVARIARAWRYGVVS